MKLPPIIILQIITHIYKLMKTPVQFTFSNRYAIIKIHSFPQTTYRAYNSNMSLHDFNWD